MIYLDNNATTVPLNEVVEAVCQCLRECPGNPSSAHAFGLAARRQLERAREQIAEGACGADPSQLVFTSSGTESINTAFALLLERDISQIVHVATDHSAVMAAALRWNDGRRVKSIPVDSEGQIDLDELRRAVDGKLSLVSVTAANNETGMITALATVAEICRRANARLHVDGVQAFGKIPLRMGEIGCDAISGAAHKFHGPRGCGLLFLRNPHSRCGTMPIFGGHQEFGIRAGTENLPAIVGTAVAVLAFQSYSDWDGMARCRDDFETELLARIPGCKVHSARAIRLPNTTSLYCPFRNAADLVVRLNQMGVAVSAGAACSTGGEPSHVIRSMGFSREQANSTLRISMSRFTTPQELKSAAEMIVSAVQTTLRSRECM